MGRKKVSPEQKALSDENRNRRWQHSGLIGRTRFCITVMNDIKTGQTTDQETKACAAAILEDLYILLDDLKHKRVDLAPLTTKE